MISGGKYVFRPFGTALPVWGYINWNLSLSPQRECRYKGMVMSGGTYFFSGRDSNILFYVTDLIDLKVT